MSYVPYGFFYLYSCRLLLPPPLPSRRFHVFILTDQPITDPHLYKYTVQTLCRQKKWNPDTAAIEASRYFFRHSDILFARGGQMDLPIKRFLTMKNAEDKYRALKQKESPIIQTRETVCFERTRYYTMLAGGELLADGARYAKSSQILGAMLKCGLNEDECVRLFERYSVFGNSFNRETIRKRYSKWKH